LKDVQQRRVHDYLRNEEKKVSVLDKVYVDLRIHDKKDNYKRLEKRTSHDIIELQKGLEGCRPISIAKLFLPRNKKCSVPRRILVIGKAAIGKSMLRIRILDQWLKGQLPPAVRHVFYFALRHVSRVGRSSLKGLFHNHHEEKNQGEFVKLITTCPEQCVLLFDGADEFKLDHPICSPVDFQQPFCMRKLVSSIIQGECLERVCVLVTSRPGGIPDFIPDNTFERTAEIYGLTQDKISLFVSKFSGKDRNEKKCIKEYINRHPNVACLCYIPLQCSFVCRIVRDMNMYHRKEPTTLTQLYVMAVNTLVIAAHPRYKGVGRVNVDVLIYTS